MELKKLERNVLKLWYIRAGFISIILITIFVAPLIILHISNVPNNVLLSVALCTGMPILIILSIILIFPYLRYKMYAWGYDDKKIIVQQGVIFKKRVVIPVCQIQDLHRFQGPIMMMLKLSGVTISTAGSNFNISTLTTLQADEMIDDLEKNLELRIEEIRNEKI